MKNIALYTRTQDPLDNLEYFTEWGGNSWIRFVNEAITEFLGKELRGLRVLDIGTRSGKMACLFGLLGADVVGIDINESALAKAQEEARRWGIDEHVKFRHYDGSLGIFDNEYFDVAFTKSVLVVVPELERFLADLRTKMRRGGRIVFIENGRGGILHYLRAIKHYGQWKYSDAHYFNDKDILTIKKFFDLVTVQKSMFPPVWMMLGRVQTESSG